MIKQPKIERLALETLKNCYDSNIDIPVDIELVAELSGHIYGISTLHKLSKKFNVAAILCTDPQQRLTIIVDQDEFDDCSVRSRFSVAHELGHAIMHPDIYKDIRKYTVKESIRIQKKSSELSD